MLTHGAIWDAIDALAQRHGFSVSGLARLAGLDATAFNRSKRVSKDGRERWPSTESIAKVLEATGENFDQFLSAGGAYLQAQVNAATRPSVPVARYSFTLSFKPSIADSTSDTMLVSSVLPAYRVSRWPDEPRASHAVVATAASRTRTRQNPSAMRRPMVRELNCIRGSKEESGKLSSCW